MKLFDVVIIGGSFSAISAALFLGNCLRKVLIIDRNHPRNQGVHFSHNMPGFDGQDPATYLAIIREEITRQPTVESLLDEVIAVSTTDTKNLIVNTRKGDVLTTKKLIFATGMKDILPDIDGIQPFWPHNILHCPYCSAPSLKNAPLSVLNSGHDAFELTNIVKKWSDDLMLLTNDANNLTPTQRLSLQTQGVPIVSKKISNVDGKPGQYITINFEDGQSIQRRAIFMHLPYEQNANALLTRLGITLNNDNLVPIDGFHKTAVEHVYAIGDMAMLVQKVSTAIASGTTAAFNIDHELSMEQ